MESCRLSVNKLADFSGLGRGTVSDILNGKMSPSLRTIGKLSGALGCTVRDLMPTE